MRKTTNDTHSAHILLGMLMLASVGGNVWLGITSKGQKDEIRRLQEENRELTQKYGTLNSSNTQTIEALEAFKEREKTYYERRLMRFMLDPNYQRFTFQAQIAKLVPFFVSPRTTLIHGGILEDVHSGLTWNNLDEWGKELVNVRGRKIVRNTEGFLNFVTLFNPGHGGMGHCYTLLVYRKEGAWHAVVNDPSTIDFETSQTIFKTLDFGVNKPITDQFLEQNVISLRGIPTNLFEVYTKDECYVQTPLTHLLFSLWYEKGILIDGIEYKPTTKVNDTENTKFSDISPVLQEFFAFCDELTKKELVRRITVHVIQEFNVGRAPPEGPYKVSQRRRRTRKKARSRKSRNKRKTRSRRRSKTKKKKPRINGKDKR